VRVAFILNQHNTELKSRGVLFSIHDEDVPVFRLLRLRARRAPGLIEDAKEVLLKLFDADAEYSPTRWKASTTSWRRSASRCCPAT
jgi:magnesium transporter